VSLLSWKDHFFLNFNSGFKPVDRNWDSWRELESLKPRELLQPVTAEGLFDIWIGSLENEEVQTPQDDPSAASVRQELFLESMSGGDVPYATFTIPFSLKHAKGPAKRLKLSGEKLDARMRKEAGNAVKFTTPDETFKLVRLCTSVVHLQPIIRYPDCFRGTIWQGGFEVKSAYGLPWAGLHKRVCLQ
jgi:hypothetical protein